MLTLKDLKKNQEQLFGYNIEDTQLIDKQSLQRAQQEILASLKQNQTERIKNSRKIISLKVSQHKIIDLEKIQETDRLVDNINKINRINQKSKAKQEFADKVLKQVDEFQLYDGSKIPMRDIEQIFSTIGYELSKIQLNEVFLLMDAGRNFNRKRFEKWLIKNSNFIGLADSPGKSARLTIAQNNNNSLSRNKTSLSPLKVYQNNMDILQTRNLNTFTQSRKTVDYHSQKPVGEKYLQKHLNNWSRRILKFEDDIIDDEEQRKNKEIESKLKFSSPIFQGIREKKLLSRKKKNLNKTVDDTSAAAADKKSNSQNNTQNVFKSSLYGGSKINFFQPKVVLERIEEDPTQQQNQKQSMNMTLGKFQTIRKVSVVDGDNNDSSAIDNVQYKQETNIFNNQAVKGNRGTFYDTLNTTFYTQTDSYYDEEHTKKKHKKKLLKLEEVIKQNKDQRDMREDYLSKQRNQLKNFNFSDLLEVKLEQDKDALKSLQQKKEEIAKAFDLIERNKRAQSLLSKAFEKINKSQVDRTTERARDYQEEVRKRLREKKFERENSQEHNVQYIASMLPSAMDMHRFIKFMRKDKVFESDTGFRIVSQIRTHKDQERLEYLLNYKLSAT